MSVHRLDDPTLHRPVRQQWYFACPQCGWCSPLKRTHWQAVRSRRRHLDAKKRAA